MQEVGTVVVPGPSADDDVLRRVARKTEVGREVKRLSITAWIFIAMVFGITLGLLSPGPTGWAVQMAQISNIFLRLIKSIIAPLLFGTLVAGIAGTGSVKAMGRIGGKAILYFEIVTTLALGVGLAAVNLLRPGDGLVLKTGAGAAAALKTQAPELTQ